MCTIVIWQSCCWNVGGALSTLTKTLAETCFRDKLQRLDNSVVESNVPIGLEDGDERENVLLIRQI